MSFLAGNEHSFSSLQFPSLCDASIGSQHDQDQILRTLGLVFSDTEVLQLCDLVRSVPQAAISQSVDHYRLDGRDSSTNHDNKLTCIAASFSILERLLLLKARLPQLFRTTGAEDILRQATSNRQGHFGTVPAPSQPDAYNALPPPPRQATSADWHVCIACDMSYAAPSGLKKHQSSLCERQFDWMCPSCPNLVFYQETDLYKHHSSIHAETCSSCCDTRKSLPSDPCKAALSLCFREGSEKKAWGCPCCLSCFDTLGAWKQHMTIHQIHNEKVQDWSFSTMVRSLLLHRCLAAVSHRYDWRHCNWAHLGKNACQILRSALERHVLPSNIYFPHLDLAESLVLYAFHLGTVGNIYANATSVNISQLAVAEVPCYNNGPSDQCSVVSPLVQGPYAERDFEKFTGFEGDEQQGIPSTLASESADDKELEPVDYLSLQYQSAFGTMKPLYKSDHGPQPEIQVDPAILGAYIQSSQNNTGKARTKKRIAMRIKRRTPVDGRFLAKQQARNQPVG
jgi:hypothetical protein